MYMCVFLCLCVVMCVFLCPCVVMCVSVSFLFFFLATEKSSLFITCWMVVVQTNAASPFCCAITCVPWHATVGVAFLVVAYVVRRADLDVRTTRVV